MQFVNNVHSTNLNATKLDNNNTYDNNSVGENINIGNIDKSNIVEHNSNEQDSSSSQIACQDNSISFLKELRISNPHRIIIGQLNINSLRNKFDFLTQICPGNIDILLITETKLDNSFPTAQFTMKGYSTPYRLDRNKFGGGILLYVREDIPSKIIRTEFDNKTEAMFIEINLRKKMASELFL